MEERASYKTFLIDASVAIKWFNEEEDSDKASALQHAYQSEEVTLLVPALLYWEMGNFLGRVFDEKTATQAFNILKNHDFKQVLLTLEGAALALHMMKKYPGITFYDASYHSLAIQYQVTFLTADKKYYDKTKKLGNIMLLKDY